MDELVLVRAIVRTEMLERVVRRLKESGVPRLTVARVHAIGAGVDPAMEKLSLEESSAYADKAEVQFVYAGSECAHYTEMMAEAARTGRRGDGIVFVQPVADVTKVRTGARGIEALR